MPPDSAVLNATLVREVARTLAGDLTTEETLRGIVDLLHRQPGVRRATIWRRAPNGTRLVGVTAPSAEAIPEAEALEPLLSGGGAGSWRLAVTRAGHRLGVVDVELAPEGSRLSSEDVALVADLLAPFLDAVLLSEDLAAEVAIRAREVQAQRRFTSLIIDSLPVGLYVVDRDYRIQIWNRKRETGTQGLRRDQVVGRRVFEVLTRQPGGQLQAEFDQIFETGETTQWEQSVEIAGERRVFRLSKIPMRLDGETISHVITIGEDVTERRLTEERILQSEKLAAVGQLAAGVMHEINNPLATIGACVAAIEGRLEDPGTVVREYLDIIEAEVHRCTRIVDQLLDFSRPRQDRGSREPTDLNALLEQTLYLLKHHSRFKRMAVERGFGEDLPPVLVDGERMVQAFMAILLNAADAMERGGTVRIRSARSPQRPDEAVVELEDTGVGIPAAALSKIFEPFYTTKPPGRGTGLGLTICYGIVEEQGGRIAVQSQPGVGTTFRIYLPLVAEVSP